MTRRFGATRGWMAWTLVAAMLTGPTLLPLVGAAPPEETVSPDLEARIAELRVPAPEVAVETAAPAAAPPAMHAASADILAGAARAYARAFPLAPAPLADGPEAARGPSGPSSEGNLVAAAVASRADVGALDPLPLPELRVEAPLEMAPVAPAFKAPPAPPWSTDLPAPGGPAELQALTYIACAQVAGQSPRCSAPVPFGVPVPLDADGSPTTGTAGNDVLVTLLPASPPGLPGGPGALPSDASQVPAFANAAMADLATPGVGVTMRADVLPDAASPLAPRDLAAAAWVEYRVMGSATVLRAGIDGRMAKLPGTATVQVEVKDLPQLAQGRLVGGVDIVFTGAGPKASLFAGMAAAGGRSTTATVQLEPVPNLHLDVDAMLDGSAFTAALRASQGFVATVTYEATGGGQSTRIESVVNRAPTDVRVEYQRLTDGVRVKYDATAAVGSVTASIQRTTASDSVSGTLAIATLPDNVEVVVQPGSASGALKWAGSAGIASVSAAVSRTSAGVTTVATATATGLPSSFEASWATASPASVTWDATGSLGSISLSLNSGAGRLAVSASVTNTPPFLQARWQDGLVELDARTSRAGAPGSGALGAVTVNFASDGQLLASWPAGDHLALVQPSASATRAHVQYSGLKLLKADTRTAMMQFEVRNTAPRVFTLSATTPTGQVSQVVDSVPATLAITIDMSATGRGSIAYAASGPIASVLASASRGALTLSGSIANIPGSVTLAWDTAASPATLTYEASGALGPIALQMASGPAKPAFRTSVSSVPPFVQATFGPDVAIFDARTARTAAPGSAALGAVSLGFASDGVFLAAQPAEDHLTIAQPAAGVTRVDFLYTGLKLAKYDVRGGAGAIELRNTGPRVFKLQASGPTGQVTGVIDSVPATLVLALDLAGQRLTYAASAPIAAIDLGASLAQGGRTWTLGLGLQGIPAQWEAAWGSGHALFRGVTAPLGLVRASVTNHGTATTFAGNHLSAVYRDATGDVDASFAMSQVSVAEYLKTADGLRIDLRLGGGALLSLHGDVVAGGTKALAEVTLNPLPSSIQVTQAGDVFTYVASQNFELNAYTEVGSALGIAAAPAPPVVHGLAVRDGRGCAGGLCADGIRARLWLTGFPTGLSSDASSRTFSVTNFRPAVSSLSIDVELDNVASPAVDLRAVQSGIPSPVSLTFGPAGTADITRRTCIKFPTLICKDEVVAKETHVSYSATAPLGALTVDVTVGANAARLEVSNIPSSMNAVITQGKDNSSAAITMGQGIARVFAGAKASTSDATFAGGLELLQVPAELTLAWGKVKGTGTSSMTAPGVNYEASAGTLDINAWVDASLFANDAEARARLAVVDLAPYVSATLEGSKLTMVSRACAPGDFRCPIFAVATTKLLEIHVWAEGTFDASDTGCYNSNGNPNCTASWVKYTYDLRVTPTIQDFSVRLTDVRTLVLELGFLSAVEGTFGTLRIGWASITVGFDIDATARLWQDVCPFDPYCPTVLSPEFRWSYGPATVPVNMGFYYFGDTEGLWDCFSGVKLYTTPNRFGSMTTNQVVINGADVGLHGGTIYFMPVPPGLDSTTTRQVAEVVATQLVPSGHTGKLRVVIATC